MDDWAVTLERSEYSSRALPLESRVWGWIWWETADWVCLFLSWSQGVWLVGVACFKSGIRYWRSTDNQQVSREIAVVFTPCLRLSRFHHSIGTTHCFLLCLHTGLSHGSEL